MFILGLWIEFITQQHSGTVNPTSHLLYTRQELEMWNNVKQVFEAAFVSSREVWVCRHYLTIYHIFVFVFLIF